MMNTTFREEDGKYIATLEGRLDTSAAEKTAQDLAPLNDCVGHDIIIDCEKLEYISSSGLRILLNIRKNAGARGSNVIIRKISSDIRKVFQMTGFTSLFKIED